MIQKKGGLRLAPPRRRFRTVDLLFRSKNNNHTGERDYPLGYTNMNIEKYIKPEIWKYISQSYESENYSDAIKDAMAVITELLRDKTGLDGDGRKLVGKALGFDKNKQPRIRINKLQTETERNIQIGLREILSGMYSLIRNPRVHEKVEDTQDTADAIIIFIDYLVNLLGGSQASFTVQGFMDLVKDPYFAHDSVYVNELVKDIPVRKRLDILIKVYEAKTESQADNYMLIIHALLDMLEANDVEDFLKVVSNELQTAKEEDQIGLVINVLPSIFWPKIQKMPRLRIENMLLNCLKGAWYSPETQMTNSAPSAWISSIAEYFTRKNELRTAILAKFNARDQDHHNYVANYLMTTLPILFKSEVQIEECAAQISRAVRSGNKYLVDCLVDFLSTPGTDSWVFAFDKCLKELLDPDNPGYYILHGMPFLGKFQPKPNPLLKTIDEDDIPF